MILIWIIRLECLCSGVWLLNRFCNRTLSGIECIRQLIFLVYEQESNLIKLYISDLVIPDD